MKQPLVRHCMVSSLTNHSKSDPPMHKKASSIAQPATRTNGSDHVVMRCSGEHPGTAMNLHSAM